MRKKKNQEDFDYHFDFWKQTYQEKLLEFSYAMKSFMKLRDDLAELERQAKNIDANRRENAVNLGVSIIDSDKAFDFDIIRKGVPEMIENIKKYERIYS